MRVDTLFKFEVNDQCVEVIITPADVSAMYYFEIVPGHGTPYSYIIIVSHAYHSALEASGCLENFKRSMDILADVLTRDHPIPVKIDK